MSYQDLIGKTAPSIKLLNYDGEPFTFTPGQKDVPTALFFYPESGMNAIFFFYLSLRSLMYSALGSYGCTKQACQFRNAIAGKAYSSSIMIV